MDAARTAASLLTESAGDNAPSQLANEQSQRGRDCAPVFEGALSDDALKAPKLDSPCLDTGV